MDRSLRHAGIWRLKGHETVLHGEDYTEYAHGFSTLFIRFHMTRDEEWDVSDIATYPHDRGIQSEYNVDVGLKDGEVRASCQCHFSAFWGIPCQHVARLAELFRERSDGRMDIRSLLLIGTLPLLSLFTKYWYKDQEEWLKTVLSEREKRVQEEHVDFEDDDAGDGTGEPAHIVVHEHVEMVRTQDTLNLANQSVRAVVTMGPHMLI